MTTSTFEYDKLGRLTKKVTLAGAVYYAYDASGKKTSLKDRDLKENVYVWDDDGRLEKVEIDAARSAYYVYDASGLMAKKVLPEVVMSYFSYDSAGRLSQLENRGPTYAAEITYFAYTRNENGAITRMRHEDNEDTYHSYDALERLTREWRLPTMTDRDFDNEYEYDAASNRTRKRDVATQEFYYTYDSRNLVTKEHVLGEGGNYFDYDDAQRMTAWRQGVSPGQSAYFDYDQRDNVTEVDFTKSGGGADDRRLFSYTGVGERSRIQIGNPISLILDSTFDGRKLLTERNPVAIPSGVTLRRYRHNRSRQERLGSALEIEQSDGKLYPSMDQRGTVGSLARDFGGGEIVEDAYLFDAFGNLVTSSEPISTDERLKFVGPVFEALNLDNQAMSMFGAGGGVYLPSIARSTVSVTRFLAHGGMGLFVGGPDDDDGDDPRDTPPPVVYGEEIDSCPLPPEFASDQLLFRTDSARSSSPSDQDEMKPEFFGHSTAGDRPKPLIGFPDAHKLVGTGLQFIAAAKNCKPENLHFINVVYTTHPLKGCNRPRFVDPCSGGDDSPFYYPTKPTATNPDRRLAQTAKGLAEGVNTAFFDDSPSRERPKNARDQITWNASLCFVCHCPGTKNFVILQCYWWGWTWNLQKPGKTVGWWTPVGAKEPPKGPEFMARVKAEFAGWDAVSDCCSSPIGPSPKPDPSPPH